MILGIGNDITEVQRIQDAIEKHGERFLKRVFTPTEIEYCQSYKEEAPQHFAARFAAKEAFSKAIGTGFTQGFKLNEFGIINEKSGAPKAEISGMLAEKYGYLQILVTLSHSKDYAIANIILQK